MCSLQPGGRHMAAFDRYCHRIAVIRRPRTTTWLGTLSHVQHLGDLAFPRRLQGDFLQYRRWQGAFARSPSLLHLGCRPILLRLLSRNYFRLGRCSCPLWALQLRDNLPWSAWFALRDTVLALLFLSNHTGVNFALSLGPSLQLETVSRRRPSTADSTKRTESL